MNGTEWIVGHEKTQIKRICELQEEDRIVGLINNVKEGKPVCLKDKNSGLGIISHSNVISFFVNNEKH